MCEQTKVKVKNTETFIARSKQVHGDTYDYSSVNYVNSKTTVDIICRVHGVFSQKPSSHTSGRNCNKCRYDKISDTTETFIEKATKLHSGKYTYDKVVYVSSKKPVIITCPEHGDFEQKPSLFLLSTSPRTCPECKKSLRLGKVVVKQPLPMVLWGKLLDIE